MSRSGVFVLAFMSTIGGLAAATPAFANGVDTPPPHTTLIAVIVGGLAITAVVVVSWLLLRVMAARDRSGHLEEHDDDR